MSSLNSIMQGCVIHASLSYNFDIILLWNIALMPCFYHLITVNSVTMFFEGQLQSFLLCCSCYICMTFFSILKFNIRLWCGMAFMLVAISYSRHHDYQPYWIPISIIVYFVLFCYSVYFGDTRKLNSEFNSITLFSCANGDNDMQSDYQVVSVPLFVISFALWLKPFHFWQ